MSGKSGAAITGSMAFFLNFQIMKLLTTVLLKEMEIPPRSLKMFRLFQSICGGQSHNGGVIGMGTVARHQ